MGLFSSSSSSSSSSTQPLPTRQARKACWDSRDVYYACLSKANVVIPPGTDMSDARGAPAGKAEAAAYAQKEKERERLVHQHRETNPCKRERGAYEENCAKSWVDYFNKRRVLEERQRMMYAAGAQPLSNQSGGGASSS